MCPDPEPPDLDLFRRDARAWLSANAARRRSEPERRWGVGNDSMAIFRDLSLADERAQIDALRAWQRRKCDAGYGSITLEPRYGGRGLSRAHERAFLDEEAAFETPENHEAVGITLDLIGPTIRRYGSASQRTRFLPPLRRTDEMWCQLFSEPDAGSDVAGLATKARRDGSHWIINGQKVWTSGAQFADWGYLIARSDTTAPRHQGLTAFLIPMRDEGVEIRPLRQATGGSSFNEVFFTDVRIPDSLRLGRPGEGWQVALTTLGFERAASNGGLSNDHWLRIRELATHLGRTDDLVVRQELAALYIHLTLLRMTALRAAALNGRDAVPGPEGSVIKLFWSTGLRRTGELASQLLGPALVADCGEWGTFTWNEFVMGATGFRIAGGTDEIQRNIIGERVLNLPREPVSAGSAMVGPTDAAAL